MAPLRCCSSWCQWCYKEITALLIPFSASLQFPPLPFYQVKNTAPVALTPQRTAHVLFWIWTGSGLFPSSCGVKQVSISCFSSNYRWLEINLPTLINWDFSLQHFQLFLSPIFIAALFGRGAGVGRAWFLSFGMSPFLCPYELLKRQCHLFLNGCQSSARLRFVAYLAPVVIWVSSTLCLRGNAGRCELQWAAAWAVNDSPDLESCGAANRGSGLGSTVLYKGFALEAVRQPFSLKKDSTP